MTSGNVSDDVVTMVRAALRVAGAGLTYQDIHDRVGMWSIISIKHAVRQLREEGLVVRKGPHNLPRFALTAEGA